MSKELWIAVADAVFAIATVLVTGYLAPEHLAVALALIAILQPLVLALINGLVKMKVAALEAIMNHPAMGSMNVDKLIQLANGGKYQ